MSMGIFKKYKWLIILALVVLAGVSSFFYRFYHNDVKALAHFSTSYEKFDKAISDFFISKADELESQAGDALIELNTKATFRLSSIIRNDAELMEEALEVADLSRKELDSIRVKKAAIQSKNDEIDALAKEYGVLTSKRRAAYARFRKLAGFND
jgi:hypothetical protein